MDSGKTQGISREEKQKIVVQAERVQRQSRYFLRALRFIYLGLGCFIFSTFLALLGATLSRFYGSGAVQAFAFIGLTVGGVGMVGLTYAAMTLIRANDMALSNVTDDLNLLEKKLFEETV